MTLYTCLYVCSGDREGLSSQTCSGPCDGGYYCPAGSTSTTELPCGSIDVFCPQGSDQPQPVYQGYYTVGLSPITCVAQEKCQPGSWCNRGIKRLCDGGRWVI